jgi:hypothetical protein
MIDKEQLVQMLETHEQELKGAILEQLKKSIEHDIAWSLQQEISAIVKKWMAEDIAPEVRAALVETKPAVLAAVAEAAEAVGHGLAEAMVAQCKENLERSSYKRAGLIKALFE